MTLNRYLLLFTTLISTILAFLSFSPPQTGKWVYMWQAYVLEIGRWTKLDGLRSHARWKIAPPPNYTGKWLHWSKKAQLTMVSYYEDGEPICFGTPFYTNLKEELNGEMEMRYFDGTSGMIHKYTNNGELLWVETVNSPHIVIYDPYKKIDRRAEFEIPIE